MGGRYAEKKEGVPRAVYPALFLLAAGTLLLEVSLTRFLSYSHWYHFAFMVISLALLGFGASGVFLTLLPERILKNPLPLLALFSLLFALSALLGFCSLSLIPFDPYLLVWQRTQLLHLFLFCLVLSLPFLFTGAALGAPFRAWPGRAGPLYAWNLIGSSLGCLAILFVFRWFGGTRVILLCAFLGAVAFFLFALPWRRILALLGLLPIGFGLFGLCRGDFRLPQRVSEYKGLRVALTLPDAETVFTRWNALSRVDLVKSRYIRYAPGLSLSYEGSLPPQILVATDGDSSTVVADFEEGDETFTTSLLSAAPYAVRRMKRVLIVGSGGGTEIEGALRQGAEEVVALEINPAVVEAVRRAGSLGFPDPYTRAEVRLVMEEGRSHLERSRERYDLIEISLMDTMAASSAGLHSLTENYLYTVEAFRAYYRRLRSGGLLAVTRWIHVPPRDNLRVFVTAYRALREEGVEKPEESLVFLRG